MLILGEKYKFTKLELQRLNQKFSSIHIIVYKDKNPNKIIAKINENLQDNFTIIVLNTKIKVDNKIIKYLTNLKFNKNKKKFKFITIEHFLEKYLHKCYIPDNNNDLHYLDEIVEFTFFQKIQKKLIDIIVIFGLFIVFALLKLFVKYKIKMQSPGKVYFKQLRVGLNNKEFICIKFRSMHENAEKYGARFTKKNDNRIFAFGKTMRKLRIDEIPQIFNVLKGEMSLIGPRPERLYWIKKDFEKQIPYYNQRHIIKPGITGWAQVMYSYGDSIKDARQKLMYDLYYIKYWSLLLELKIIYKTILIIFKKKGT